MGPVVADMTRDSRWESLSVSLVAGGKSNLNFALVSDAGLILLRHPGPVGAGQRP